MIESLFQLDKNQQVIVSPEALTLAPFKKLWDKDKTKDKKHALADFTFMYQMYRYSSIFQNIINEDIRAEEIMKVVNNFQGNSPELEEACDFFKRRQNTLSMDLLETTKLGVQKLKDYIRNVDLEEKDPKTNKLVHDPKKVKDIVDNIGNTVESIKQIEDIVKREIEADSGMKGSKDKAMFEDGFG